MDAHIHARVDSEIKQAASNILAAMGLSISDAIRLMLLDVINKRSFHVRAKVPNKETMEAIEELRAGRGTKCRDVDSLFRSLNEED